jgi:protein-L-isoaspartate(D-aspartate) O-methyltransferase
MEESFLNSRLEMVENQIRKRGVRNAPVLDSFRKVPRHEFVPATHLSKAYSDCPLPIGKGQTISQPYMVASMTEAARIYPGMKILEVGTGSGYQTAILAELGAEVFTIERIPELSKKAQKVLIRLGYESIQYRIGDGSAGWTEEAPFGAIVVSAGAPTLPEPLVQQLDIAGRLVIPIEDNFSQILTIITRTEDGFEETHAERCTFVPLIGQYGWEK